MPHTIVYAVPVASLQPAAPRLGFPRRGAWVRPAWPLPGGGAAFSDLTAKGNEMNKPRPYRTACGYIRSSASGPRLYADLLNQARRINAFCCTSMHVLTCTAVEAQASGSQPELDRLLDEAISPDWPYDLLIVASESRLSPELATLQQVKARLTTSGVALVVLDNEPASAVTLMAVDRASYGEETKDHRS
jgi:hypothetical protein